MLSQFVYGSLRKSRSAHPVLRAWPGYGATGEAPERLLLCELHEEPLRPTFTIPRGDRAYAAASPKQRIDVTGLQRARPGVPCPRQAHSAGHQPTSAVGPGAGRSIAACGSATDADLHIQPSPAMDRSGNAAPTTTAPPSTTMAELAHETTSAGHPVHGWRIRCCDGSSLSHA